jgi:hypothetical protein
MVRLPAEPAGRALCLTNSRDFGNAHHGHTGSPTSFNVKMTDSAGNSMSQSCDINVGPAPDLSGRTGRSVRHVAGIIGSNGNGSVYIGMAPKREPDRPARAWTRTATARTPASSRRSTRRSRSPKLTTSVSLICRWAARSSNRRRRILSARRRNRLGKRQGVTRMWCRAFNVVWGVNVVWGASTNEASQDTGVAINGEP